MGKNFVGIHKAEMDHLLKSGGFSEVDLPTVKEAVYDRPFNSVPRLVIRVYSSIEGEVNRSCGSDAIRVCLVDKVLGRGVGSTGRINRVGGWEDRLKAKIRDMFNSAKELDRCPKCNYYMVERTNSKDGSKFHSCSRYPLCNGTRNHG